MPDPRPAHGGYPDTTPAPTGGDDVYLTAARAWYFDVADADLLPEAVEAVAGWTYFRAAVDAARAPLEVEVARLRAENAEQDAYLSGVVDEVETTNARLMAQCDEARRQLADATAATERGEWVTEYTLDNGPGTTPIWRAFGTDCPFPGVHNAQRRVYRMPATRWPDEATPVDGTTP